MTKTSELIKKQRRYFETNETRSIAYRKQKLLLLRKVILAKEEEIFSALAKDLGKSKFESYETEVGIVLNEITYMLRHLDALARPKLKKTPLTLFPAKSFVLSEPYGVVLIMSPWNYPFQLALVPLIGAIAAGNCAILKPSNYSTHTSNILKKILGRIYSDSYVSVVLGGREENQDLLLQNFDYIFFTGSVHVGKLVMEAASKHLTPVTLELGGKSPCIVDKTANIKLAAKRIIWGKLINAGQTCVAPDYIMAEKGVRDLLIRYMQHYAKEFYGDDIKSDKSYPKIITEKHFMRLQSLYKEETYLGGEINEAERKIAPVYLPNATFESKAMQEEIFGPILPIIEYEDLDSAITEIRKRPKPLALYLFTNSKRTKAKVLREVSFGGGCINDTIVHFANGNMPFGGVGESGMGSYHEAESFATFSHRKSIADRALTPDVPIRYLPAKGKLELLKKILK